MIIPKHAKSAFKWIVFDIYQWKQELFDGSFTTFEWIRRNPATIIIPITIDHKIVLCREIQPGHANYETHFFGWSCEDWEEYIQNAKKELLEEAWMSSDNFLEINKADRWNNKLERFAYYFLAIDAKKIQEPTPEPWEKIEVLTYDLDDFVSNYKNIITDSYQVWFVRDVLIEKLRESGLLKSSYTKHFSKFSKNVKI